MTRAMKTLRTLIADEGERKPETWEEIEDEIRADDPRVRDLLPNLPVLSWPCPPSTSYARMPGDLPSVCIVKLDDGNRFLVSTEGFTYARYAIRLV